MASWVASDRQWLWAGVLLLGVVTAAVGFLGGHPLYALLPLIGILAVVVGIRQPTTLWLALLVFTPISLEFEVSKGLALTLPTDLLALGTMLAAWLLWGRHRRVLWPYLNQPLGWLLIAIYSWLCVTTVVSTETVRSIKFLAVMTWQGGAFLLFPLVVFHFRPKWLYQWWKLLVPGALIAFLYVTARHAQSGFQFHESSNVVEPFFFDHGPYATLLAFVACLAFVYGLYHWRQAWWSIPVSVLLFVGVVLSYSRASWLGAVLAGGVGVLLLAMRYAPRLTLVTSLVLGLFFALSFGQDLLEISEGGHYEQDSLAEQFRSIFHTQGNASNQERINRWVAALHMADERPLTGFGPNSYVVRYDRFQESRYGTEITTYLGDVGGAHSEVLTAAAEMGYPGMVLAILYVIVIGYYLVREYLLCSNPKLRLILLGLACAMVSYFPQFAVNYLIDQDEISGVVFLTLAVLLHTRRQRLSGASGAVSVA